MGRKKLYLLMIGLTFSLALTVNLTLAQGVAKIGEQAPQFTLYDLFGNKTSLSDFKGDVVVLHFGATWCGGCQMQAKAFEKLWQTYKTKEGVHFLGIDIGETQACVLDFVKHYKITFPVLVDVNYKVRDEYGITRIPANVIIDQNGIIRAKGCYLGNESMIGEIIDRLLAGEEIPDELLETREAFEIKLKSDEVYEFKPWKVEREYLEVEFKEGILVPGFTEKGITALIVMGGGEFTFMPAVDYQDELQEAIGEKILKDTFDKIFIRINPGEYTSLVKEASLEKISDEEYIEDAQRILDVDIRGSYHIGKRAMIPPKGAFVAEIYTKRFGKLLYFETTDIVVLFSRTDKKMLVSFRK